MISPRFAPARLLKASLASATALTLIFCQAASAEPMWLQIEANPSLAEGQQAAREWAATLPNVSGFAMTTGMYAIAIGPFDTREAADAQRVLLRGERVVGDWTLVAGLSTLQDELDYQDLQQAFDREQTSAGYRDNTLWLKARQGVRYPVLEGLMVGDPRTLEPVPSDGETIGARVDVAWALVSNGDWTVEPQAALAWTDTDLSGIDSVDITTEKGAYIAMKKIDDALDQVNGARATLGAVQSRFENAVANIQIGVENLSASRGRIMDADFAKETANLSRSQILQQAGTAMVAQANQAPQGVLSLLR